MKGSATFEGMRQEWVSTATTWGSKFGDLLRKREQRLGDRKTDGDAAGDSGDGDGGD